MSENQLVVERREATGKGVARKLRAAGRIPAVLYGQGTAPLPLSLDPIALDRQLHRSESGANTLFDLVGEGLAEKVVLVKAVQRDPVRGEPLHADLYEVNLAQTVEVEIPLHVVGTAKGVALSGGILDHALRSLSIECLPRAIPDEIQVDVSELDVGEVLHVRDLPLPEGVTLLDDPDLSVASVVAPAAAEEEPTVAEGEAEAAAAPAEGTAAAGADEKKA